MFCDNCFYTLTRDATYCTHCNSSVNQQADVKLLTQWHQLAKTPFFHELAEIRAGEQAENWLQDLVEKHINYKGAHTFAGKRVSTSRSKMRREIDLIVATPSKLHIIEVKNWSGALFAQGQQWIHRKRDGQQKVYPNLVSYNNEKKELLLAFLKENNIDLPAQWVSQKLIFLNKNIQLDQQLAYNPDIITLAKLQGYLAQQKRASVGQSFVCSVIEYCLSQENSALVVDGLFGRMTKEKFNDIVRLLDSVPTWDKLVLNGTRVLKGDLLGLQIGSKYLKRHDIAREVEIPVIWTRNRLLGLLKVVLKRPSLGWLRLPKQKPLALSTKDYAYFHIVGQQSPKAIPLMHLEQLVVG